MKLKLVDAFTLSEVLITLGIIGVVAAMTMPALIAKYQKNVTVNKLKKNYTTISQMFVMSQNVNGDASTWNFNFGPIYDFSDGSNYNISLINLVNTYILPYLNVAEDCGVKCNKLPTYKYLNKQEFSVSMFYAVYLLDGSIILIALDNNGKLLFDVIIYVDINGDKKPNMVGKDVFAYYISDTNSINKLKFWGPTGWTTRDDLVNSSPGGCNKNGWGRYCGALIQYDGWQIKDDYPW